MVEELDIGYRIASSTDMVRFIDKMNEIQLELGAAFSKLEQINNQLNSDEYYCGDALYDMKIFYTKSHEYIFQIIQYYAMASAYVQNTMEKFIDVDAILANVFQMGNDQGTNEDNE